MSLNSVVNSAANPLEVQQLCLIGKFTGMQVKFMGEIVTRGLHKCRIIVGFLTNSSHPQIVTATISWLKVKVAMATN